MGVVQHPASAVGGRWLWWERALFGVFGAGGFVVSLWLTYFWLFLVGAGGDCWASLGWLELSADLLLGAVAGLVVATAWVLTASSLRVAAGQRALRPRSWAAVAIPAIAITVGYLVYANAIAPDVATLGCGLQLG